MDSSSDEREPQPCAPDSPKSPSYNARTPSVSPESSPEQKSKVKRVQYYEYNDDTRMNEPKHFDYVSDDEDEDGASCATKRSREDDEEGERKKMKPPNVKQEHAEAKARSNDKEEVCDWCYGYSNDLQTKLGIACPGCASDSDVQRSFRNLVHHTVTLLNTVDSLDNERVLMKLKIKKAVEFKEAVFDSADNFIKTVSQF